MENFRQIPTPPGTFVATANNSESYLDSVEGYNAATLTFNINQTTVEGIVAVTASIGGAGGISFDEGFNRYKTRRFLISYVKFSTRL
jgi:hypothetical protein